MITQAALVLGFAFAVFGGGDFARLLIQLANGGGAEWALLAPYLDARRMVFGELGAGPALVVDYFALGLAYVLVGQSLVVLRRREMLRRAAWPEDLGDYGADYLSAVGPLSMVVSSFVVALIWPIQFIGQTLYLMRMGKRTREPGAEAARAAFRRFERDSLRRSKNEGLDPFAARFRLREQISEAPAPERTQLNLGADVDFHLLQSTSFRPFVSFWALAAAIWIVMAAVG